MAIRMVTTGRDFTVNIDGTVFTLRRITPDQDSALQRQHSRRNELQVVAYAIAKLEATVLNWDQIVVDGEPVGFKKELIAQFPENLRIRLLEELNQGGGPDPLPKSAGT